MDWTNFWTAVAAVTGIGAFIISIWSIRIAHRAQHFAELQWEHEKREKEEESKECVDTNVSFSTVGGDLRLVATILSKSTFTIPLRGVELRWSIPEQGKSKGGFGSIRFIWGGRMTMEEFQTKATFELERYKSEAFILNKRNIHPAMLKSLMEMKPDEFWVSVLSHSGEIDRVPGERFAECLVALASDS